MVVSIVSVTINMNANLCVFNTNTISNLKQNFIGETVKLYLHISLHVIHISSKTTLRTSLNKFKTERIKNNQVDVEESAHH